METQASSSAVLAPPPALSDRIAQAMLVDQPRFKRRAKRLRRAAPDSVAWLKLEEDVDASVARCAARVARPIHPQYPPELPIVAARDELLAAIGANQVVIVSGATGSGKTTQLPKLCLELGRGARALIGHTQPRRVAARRVAERISEELGPGHRGAVGYQVRFNSSVEEACRIKVMTDGILLAEVQAERRLSRYDTIILDEAHERSLNIDFLLGYLKRLLARRPDLKLIISSATIDAHAFSEFFDAAPVIEVSGRLYPVEVQYAPPGRDEDVLDAAAAAVVQLGQQQSGDILVFLPGERHIRDLSTRLRGMVPSGVEILPLYARLSNAEQDRVFTQSEGSAAQRSRSRPRVVLATNVAETSLTVPGIRHVVDTGLARVSRYSHRATVQRLPIEFISRASADQRKGRAGRLGPGVCVRLCSEEDFAQRPEFSEPEILRSNLAAVLLRLLSLGWTEVEDFPFLDPPDRRNINDGYRLLRELGALELDDTLSQVGHRLARLPLDPRVGRMLLEAGELGCLREVLVIASGMVLPDVRERGNDEASARAHERFRDSRSDFMSMLRIWRQYQQWQKDGDESRLRARCRRAFLSVARLREWQEVHDQLKDVVAEVGLRTNKHGAGYARIHRALLAGLLRNVGNRSSEREYSAVRDSTFVISPSSFQHGTGHAWVVAGELIETSRLYAFRVASIRPEWVEASAGDLLRRNHFEAHWDEDRAEAMVYEQTSVYGLVVVGRRRVRFAPVSRSDARDIFIRAGLVEDGYQSSANFLAANRELVARLREFDHKLRRPDVLTSDERIFEFYAAIVPEDVFDGAGFEAWRRGVERTDPRRLYMREQGLLNGNALPELAQRYPDFLSLDELRFTLRYRFAPKAEDDGITARINAGALRELDPAAFEWLVPGLLEEKTTALLRMLPKSVRRGLVPLPECASAFVQSVPEREPGELPTGSLRLRLAEFVARWRGVRIPLQHWSAERMEAELEPRLRMRFEVIDDAGLVIERGRNLAELQRRLLDLSPAAKRTSRLETFMDWEFGDLPETEEVERDGIPVLGYPALIDRKDSVERGMAETLGVAESLTYQGLLRLFALRSRRQVMRELEAIENFNEARLCYLLLPENDLLGHWSHSAGLQPETESAPGGGLEREFIDLVADRLYLNTQGLIRTKIGFETRLAARAPLFQRTVHSCAELVHSCLMGFRQIKALLRQEDLRLTAESRADIERHLAHLFYCGFIAQTPREGLDAYPRYINGLIRRLEKLRSGGARDGAKTQQLDGHWRRYETRLREHVERGRVDPELQNYRWMLEEYRLSVFAQELGTAYPVSPERMEQQWRQVSG